MEPLVEHYLGKDITIRVAENWTGPCVLVYRASYTMESVTIPAQVMKHLLDNDLNTLLAGGALEKKNGEVYVP